MLGLHLISRGQLDTIKSTYNNLDTLIFYNVGLAAGPGKDCNNFDLTKKTIKYYVDCKEVSQTEYLKFKKGKDNIAICTPCVSKTLNKDGTLESIGVMYTDCRVGFWVEYYSSKKVKVVGYYKENDTGNWDNIWTRGYCSKKNGTWTYYDEDGKITRQEIYKDGTIINK